MISSRYTSEDGSVKLAPGYKPIDFRRPNEKAIPVLESIIVHWEKKRNGYKSVRRHKTERQNNNFNFV